MNHKAASTLLNQVGRYPVLTKEEEQALFQRYKHGKPLESEIARRNLVRHNLRLVLKVVNRQKEGDPDDLFQEGCLGLMRAIEKFEPERGFKFSTYATNWVKAFIQRYQKKDRMIAVPVHLANELYIPVDSLNAYARQPSDNGRNFVEKIDTIKSPQKTTTAGALVTEWVEAMLLEHYQFFRPNDVLIFVSHFGLFGHTRLPYRAAGALVGVTPQAAINATNRVIYTLKSLKNNSGDYNRKYIWTNDSLRHCLGLDP